MRHKFTVCILSMVASLAFLPASAQTNNSVPSATLAALTTSPGIILDTYPAGGAGMVNFVARALSSDIGLLDKVLGLLKTANDNQKAAIGAGLARAVKFYTDLAASSIDDDAKKQAADNADLISKSIAQSNTPITLASFRSASGSAPAAIPGQSGAPGGNVGSSTPGTGSDSGGTLVTNSSANFLDSGGGSSFTASSGSTSVSPSS